MDTLTMDRLEAGLDEIRRSPRDRGRVEMIIRRPAVDAREELAEAVLDPIEGLVGDSWKTRGSTRTPDGSAHPGKQLTLMNARAASLIAGERNRWGLAGDQLYVDFDLSHENCPAGTRLALGSAIIVVTDQPHRGCSKFLARFGRDALAFVNSPSGQAMRLRGANCSIDRAGVVSAGDTIHVLP